jgi:translation initiation factor 1
MPKNNRRTVWSSDYGDQRKKNNPKPSRSAVSLPPGQQTIYLHRESKGRGGKTVSLVKGLVLSDKDLQALSKKLKSGCGSGGTIKDGIIEIQGEHRQRIADIMGKLGYKVKISGG